MRLASAGEIAGRLGVLIMPFILPMVRDLRHSLEGVILGLTSGRIGLRRSTIKSKALTDCPAVSPFPQRVYLDPE
jgi:hypothetical protein